MFNTPEVLNVVLKSKTPIGSQVVSFSEPQPIPVRLAGSPNVVELPICTQPALLLLVTVIGAANAAAGIRVPTAKTAASFKILIGYSLRERKFWQDGLESRKAHDQLQFDNHPHANRCSKIARFWSGYVHHFAQKR